MNFLQDYRIPSWFFPQNPQRLDNFQRGSRKFLGHFGGHFALTLTSDFLVGGYQWLEQPNFPIITATVPDRDLLHPLSAEDLSHSITVTDRLGSWTQSVWLCKSLPTTTKTTAWCFDVFYLVSSVLCTAFHCSEVTASFHRFRNSHNCRFDCSATIASVILLVCLHATSWPLDLWYGQWS